VPTVSSKQKADKVSEQVSMSMPRVCLFYLIPIATGNKTICNRKGRHQHKYYDLLIFKEYMIIIN